MNYYRFFISTLIYSVFLILSLTHILIFVDTTIIQKLINGYCSENSGSINLGSSCMAFVQDIKPTKTIEEIFANVHDFYLYQGQIPNNAVISDTVKPNVAVNIIDIIQDIVFSPFTGIFFALVLIRKYLRSEELFTKILMVTLLAFYITLEVSLSLDWFGGFFERF